MICKLFRFSSLLLVSLLVSLVAAPAFAQPKSATARAEYGRGTTAYKGGRYAEAAEAFSAAYTLWPKAMILYNIGQAQRKAGRFDDALLAYKRFMEEATDAERKPLEEETRRVILELETHDSFVRSLRAREDRAEVARRRTAAIQTRENDALVDSDPELPAPTQRAVIPETVITAKPDKPTPAYKRWWVWTLVGVGAVSLAVGLGVGITQHQPSTSLGIVDGKF